MVKMIPLTEPGLNDTNYAFDGVDRSRWKFDEDGVDRSRWNFDENGFQIARDKAIETARRQMVMAAMAEHRNVIVANNPNAFSYSIDGVENAPIENFKP